MEGIISLARNLIKIGKSGIPDGGLTFYNHEICANSLNLHRMKDLIWTLIIIWLVYKVFSLFRISGKPDTGNENTASGKKFSFSRKKSGQAPEALSRSLDKEGEYVDYEDVR